MPQFTLGPTDHLIVEIDGDKRRLLKPDSFAGFDTAALGLGDISLPSKPIDAIAAVFDLKGFTNFCKQIDPHLSVPLFLNAFLTWLFEQIRKEATQKSLPEGIKLWHALPFFVKFLGDGLLVLWNCANNSETNRRNIVISSLTNLSEI